MYLPLLLIQLRARYTVWLFLVVSWFRDFQVCCADVLWMTVIWFQLLLLLPLSLFILQGWFSVLRTSRFKTFLDHISIVEFTMIINRLSLKMAPVAWNIYEILLPQKEDFLMNTYEISVNEIVLDFLSFFVYTCPFHNP